MDSFISFRDICKKFSGTTILEHINLEIRQGEIFGLLGVNGAGKTTLIRCLLQLINVNSGDILLNKKHLQTLDIQRAFGFLPENFMPPRNLKGRELLNILRLGFDAQARETSAVLQLIGLERHADKYIKAYSRGMIQRLGLGCALLKSPDVLVLDEPTLGLDPLGQRDVLNLLTQLNQEGRTIFLSSHILSQMEKVCTRIGVIHQGRIRFVGTPDELKARHKSPSLEDAFLNEIESSC